MGLPLKTASFLRLPPVMLDAIPIDPVSRHSYESLVYDAVLKLHLLVLVVLLS